MIYYYSIHKNVVNEIEIKKSRFITYLFPVDNLDQVQTYLDQVIAEHPKANHHCYAYHIEDNGQTLQKANDNGEPSGTAGIPILETLKKSKVTHILAIVVRYFGGIKLGAGGLIRAYGSAVSEALSVSQLIAHASRAKLSIILDYSQNDPFQNFLQQQADVSILDTKYTENVEYIVACQVESVDTFSKEITDFLNGRLEISHLGEFTVDIPIHTIP